MYNIVKSWDTRQVLDSKIPQSKNFYPATITHKIGFEADVFLRQVLRDAIERLHDHVVNLDAKVDALQRKGKEL